jgi:hypothetical protein
VHRPLVPLVPLVHPGLVRLVRRDLVRLALLGPDLPDLVRLALQDLVPPLALQDLVPLVLRNRDRPVRLDRAQSRRDLVLAPLPDLPGLVRLVRRNLVRRALPGLDLLPHLVRASPRERVLPVLAAITDHRTTVQAIVTLAQAEPAHR